MRSILIGIHPSPSTSHRQLSPLYCTLESFSPTGFCIGDKNSSGDMASIIPKLNWILIRCPITIFYSWPSGAVKPTPSLVLANVLCILWKCYRNAINYGVNIRNFLDFFSCIEICFHNQCPRASIYLVNNHLSNSVNTMFYINFKGFFYFLCVF